MSWTTRKLTPRFGLELSGQHHCRRGGLLPGPPGRYRRGFARGRSIAQGGERLAQQQSRNTGQGQKCDEHRYGMFVHCADSTDEKASP